MAETESMFTAEELLAMPRNERRRELVRGELRSMSPSGFRHGVTAVRLVRSLSAHVERRKLGAVCTADAGFVLARNPDTVRAPDVAFVAADRIAATPDVAGFWPGAPDLAAEVVSPSDSYTAVREKVGDYLGAGARMVLVIDPGRRVVEVFRAAGDATVLHVADTIDGEDVVPGWRLPVAELFAPTA